jgi:hypothetical protein
VAKRGSALRFMRLLDHLLDENIPLASTKAIRFVSILDPSQPALAGRAGGRVSNGRVSNYLIGCAATTLHLLCVHHRYFLVLFQFIMLKDPSRPSLTAVRAGIAASCLRFSIFLHLSDTFLPKSLRASAQVSPLMCDLRATLRPFSRALMYSSPH